jgi:hypothetical protein
MSTFLRMAEELLHGPRLEVVLVPSQIKEDALRGGMIRRVTSHNPDWYRAFCARHQRGRRSRKKPDTKIKRSHTIKALFRLHLEQRTTYYRDDLVAMAEACQEPH